MNTTAAALQANVTAATIRAWCRRGVIPAAKVAGRWVIEAASLARRIALGTEKVKTVKSNLTQEFVDVVCDSADHAADAYNTVALKKLLADVQDRNIAAIMGQADADQISLNDDQWQRLATYVRRSLASARAERDDYM